LSIELDINKGRVDEGGNTPTSKASSISTLDEQKNKPFAKENAFEGDEYADHETNSKLKQKSFLSRSFKVVKQNLVSSLTRRILFLNLAALTIFLGAILYMNQFREGLINAKTVSFLTEGRIIASAIASSATATPNAITIDPDKLWELNAGESLQPKLEVFDNFTYPINPEQIAPVLSQLIKTNQTRARIYDSDGTLILDSRFLHPGGKVRQFNLPSVNGEKRRVGWVETIGNILNKILQSHNNPTNNFCRGSYSKI